MRRLLICIPVFFVLLQGCASSEILESYETDDLISIQHNEYNNCLLMVYRDQLGQTTNVLRRNGVTEIVLTYTLDGYIVLKMRGEKTRKIEVNEAGHITHRINSLLNAGEEKAGSIASI